MVSWLNSRQFAGVKIDEPSVEMEINFSEEVRRALEAQIPVVALESTVIAHGLPYPQNLETALRLESVIRRVGAVPATVGVFSGIFTVGLTEEQIEFLATDLSIRKISRRDLPIARARKLNCATTVASTAFIAHKSGIKVFATGGIGGVHRGGAADISADLPELARTPITVVCSGPKIVLDLEATREWLETFGVTVLGWKCDEMPAFYTRTSGLPIDERVDTARDVAGIVQSRDALGLSSAIVVTVPVPEKHEIPRDQIEKTLADSLRAADENGISGKNVTPFLLTRMSEQSGGLTLAANIALLESNVEVGAEIAIALDSDQASPH